MLGCLSVLMRVCGLWFRQQAHDVIGMHAICGAYQDCLRKAADPLDDCLGPHLPDLLRWLVFTTADLPPVAVCLLFPVARCRRVRCVCATAP